MPDQIEVPVYHLGITLAGAVSAGAYTAGVLDYLFETLDLWTDAKEKNIKALRNANDNLELAKSTYGYDDSVPMHNVIIEVMGGASAGSIAAALALLQLGTSSRLLYDSWVNLNTSAHHGDDDKGDHILTRLLDDDDIIEQKSINSLFNVKPIDEIAYYALESRLNCECDGLPAYVSPKLDLLFTLTSLWGVPFEIHFSDIVADTKGAAQPAHVMKYHKGVAHYTLDKKYERGDKLPLDLTNRDHLKQVLDITIASGAFPIGLASRHIKKIPGRYIKAHLDKIYDSVKTTRYEIVKQIDVSKDYQFSAVDGGVLNNEPFEQVNEVLTERIRNLSAKNRNMHQKAIVMIDPFPNFQNQNKDYQNPINVIQAANQLISTLLNQGRFKDPTLIRNFASSNVLGMVFPSREGEDKTLATGAIEGFAGFIDKSFREHDYQLGRKNCQSFLRSYFYVRYEDKANHPAFNDWKRQDEKWRRFGQTIDLIDRIPLIPDLRLQLIVGIGADHDTINTLPMPRFPKISKEDILKYREAIEYRISKIFRHSLRRVITNKRTIRLKLIPKAKSRVIVTVLSFFLLTLFIAFSFFYAVTNEDLSIRIIGILCLMIILMTPYILYKITKWSLSQYILEYIGKALKDNGQLYDE
jgi:hypothetical protein